MCGSWSDLHTHTHDWGMDAHTLDDDEENFVLSCGISCSVV
jgi:hypothetical protein